MTDPRLAHTYEWGRMYARTRGGEPEVPSITTILAVENQDLGWWEARLAVGAAIEHLRLVQDVLAEGNPQRIKGMRSWLQDAAVRDRDSASARGDFVHNYAEVYALHVMGSATDEDVAAQRALCLEQDLGDFLTSFHRFWDEFRPRPLMPEATVWNATVGYAGTTDLICEIETEQGPTLTVLDWKTKRGLFLRNGQPKRNDLQVHTGMQLAAAAFAEEVWIEGATPEEDRWEPWTYRPEMGLGVAIGPDGYAVRQYDIYDPLVWQGFVALRSAWDYVTEGGRTMGERTMRAGLRPLTPRPPG